MAVNGAERERLIRILDFLKTEIDDMKNFSRLTYSDYYGDKSKRREVERCMENIVNSALDTAKIILLHKKLAVPDTYRDYFLKLSAAKVVSEKTAHGLAQWVKLRNILAHEYLDIRWDNIKGFLNKGWKFYGDLVENTLKYIHTRQK